MYAPSNMKEGIPKQWGQHYLTKLVSGDADPILDDWAAFEAVFLVQLLFYAVLFFLLT